MTPLFFIAAAGYALATLLYLVYLFGNERALTVARIGLALTLAVHLAMIGMLCVRHHNPLSDLRGALSLTGWLIGTGYLVATLRVRLGPVGAFVSPLSLALLLGARAAPQDAAVAGGAVGPSLGAVHIALVAMGVAAFGLAAGVSMIYMLQERSLKSKRVGRLFRRAPPLFALDRVGRTLVLVGFPLYTLAVVTGVLWLTRRHPGGGMRVEYVISAVTWLIFAGVILARWTVGWRGRNAAWATVVGFVATVVVLMIYLGRRVWGG